jgi:hypothetical protein
MMARLLPLLAAIGYLLPAPMEFRPPLGALPPPPPPRLPPWPVVVREGPRYPQIETDYDGDQG